MASFISTARRLYCVACKKCQRAVPAGVTVTPKSYIKVACILCGEVRLYLASEVNLAFPDVCQAEVRKWAR